jgi:hypothetical protein
MPDRTYAFSHRGGFWKTRYSFFSTAYATLNKIMLGFNTLLKQNLTWTHNTGAINAFYGAAAAGSGIVVTFNDRPSVNKIYKSVSIEGTNNIDFAGAMVVNNSTTGNQAKASPLFAFDDKGGILYGKIQGLNEISMSNIKPVGTVVSAQNIGQNQFLFELNWINGGQGNAAAADQFGLNGGVWASYIFGVNGAFFYANPNQAVPIGQNVNAGDFAQITLENMGGNYLTLDYTGYLTSDLVNQYGTPNVNVFNNYASDVAASPITIYSITTENVNGDQLRGQIADAVINLGNNDFELFALNLEYEPTTYDHRQTRSLATSGRRRRLANT